MIMFIINSILLGVGLAMDAFSVSLADGLNAPKMSRGMRAAVPLTFGGFQFLMPMIGWFCVRRLAEAFEAFQAAVPWIALILLGFIGGKMLIATAIDALAVGFTIAEYRFPKALAAGLIIGVVTYIISFFGLRIGQRVGTRLSGKASVLGGVILIGIGIEIFVTGMFGN